MVVDEIAKVVKKANENNPLTVEDMKSMASFFKVIKNYIKMKRIEGGTGV